MKTIIAEKPSVAREIARIVGATKREEGYFEGGGYVFRCEKGRKKRKKCVPMQRVSVVCIPMRHV